jgi:hypothetical protein
MKTAKTNNPNIDLVIGDDYPGLTGNAKVKEQDATKDTQLQDLINTTDYQYELIPHITVGELRDRMRAGEQYYHICPVDSVIREVHFSAISTAYNIDYEDVYQTRLHPETHREAHNQLQYFQDRYGEDSSTRPLILD